MNDMSKFEPNVEIWHRAVDRQYGFFATAIGIFTTGLTIFGTVINSTKIELTQFEKWVFSLASFTAVICFWALLRMVHIERSVAFKAVGQNLPNVDENLQNEENCWRITVEFGFALLVPMILLIVNLIIWGK